jgi:hypothetical protein
LSIEVDQTATVAAGVTAIEVAACQFSPESHNWHDVTRITDLAPRFMCSSCGAIGVKR